MPFEFGKHKPAPVTPVTAATGMHVNALVTETDSPLENFAESASREDAFAPTRILVDTGAGPVVGLRELPLDAAHWIVQGMTIPVFVDPTNPNNYDVDWSLVPAITDLAAKNDPSLSDPMGARLRTWDALVGAGFDVLDMDKVAPKLRAMERPALKAELDAEPQAFAQQLAAVTALAAPAGYQRALAVISTQCALLVRDERRGSLFRSTAGTHPTVLAVSVPGKPAYAVYLPAFDHETREYDSDKPGLPAVVSTTNPTDVRVLWDEMPATASGPAF